MFLRTWGPIKFLYAPCQYIVQTMNDYTTHYSPHGVHQRPLNFELWVDLIYFLWNSQDAVQLLSLVTHHPYYDLEAIPLGYSIKSVLDTPFSNIKSFSNRALLVVIIDNSIGTVRSDEIERVRRTDAENAVA